MATISEAGSDENNRQISEVCDTSLISNEVNVNEGNISEPSLLNLKQNIFEEDSTNSGNIKEGNIESTMLTDERSQTNFERNTGSDIVSMNETDGNSENQRTGYIQVSVFQCCQVQLNETRMLYVQEMQQVPLWCIR